MFWSFAANATVHVSGDVFAGTMPPDTTPLHSPVVADCLSRLAPSGSHFELSSEAFTLFAALRAADLAAARSAAWRLQQMTGDAAHPRTHEAAGALGGTLRDADRDDIAAIHRTCADLIRNLLQDGIVHAVAVQAPVPSSD